MTIDADWQREHPEHFWQPGKQLLKALRSYQRLAAKPGIFYQLAKRYYVLSHRFWSVITGADIPLNCQIGGGLLIPHPNGIVIHPQAQIGCNCLINQQVTIGVQGQNQRPPIIGHHVDIGAGAKILGNIALGDHCLIGANAVVVKDAEAHSVLVGIPARALQAGNRFGAHYD